METCYGDGRGLSGPAIGNPPALSVVSGPARAGAGWTIRVGWETVAYGDGVARMCSRTGCSDPAEVTLSYDYAGSCVWLDALSDERDPHDYDLCRRHADRLTAPRGWMVRDRRMGHSDLVAV